MSVMEGFSYTELRDMPLDELMLVFTNVERISEIRKKEMNKR